MKNKIPRIKDFFESAEDSADRRGLTNDPPVFTKTKPYTQQIKLPNPAYDKNDPTSDEPEYIFHETTIGPGRTITITKTRIL